MERVWKGVWEWGEISAEVHYAQYGTLFEITLNSLNHSSKLFNIVRKQVEITSQHQERYRKVFDNVGKSVLREDSTLLHSFRNQMEFTEKQQ